METKPVSEGERIAQERKRIAIVLDAYDGPSRWKRRDWGGDGEAWQLMGLRVIWSVAIEQDSRPWLHVSVSRQERLPSYSDMALVKRLFIGPKRYAYSVWANEQYHINQHANCLHLWAVVDDEGEPLPDFTRGMGTI